MTQSKNTVNDIILTRYCGPAKNDGTSPMRLLLTAPSTAGNVELDMTCSEARRLSDDIANVCVGNDNMPLPGDRLHNGATLLAVRNSKRGGYVVLADWGTQYVTWWAGRNDLRDTGGGNYYSFDRFVTTQREIALAQAVADWAKR